MNPYLALNLSPEATDAEVRATYLQLAKRYPPARAPQEFAQIAKAYSLIDTHEKRLQIAALGLPAEEATDSVLQENMQRLRLHRPRPTWESLCRHFASAEQDA